MNKAELLNLNSILSPLTITSSSISATTRMKGMKIKIAISKLCKIVNQEREEVIREVTHAPQEEREQLFQQLFHPILLENVDLDAPKLEEKELESIISNASLTFAQVEQLYLHILI